jgi:hypothetical protein
MVRGRPAANHRHPTWSATLTNLGNEEALSPLLSPSLWYAWRHPFVTVLPNLEVFAEMYVMLYQASSRASVSRMPDQAAG